MARNPSKIHIFHLRYLSRNQVEGRFVQIIRSEFCSSSTAFEKLITSSIKTHSKGLKITSCNRLSEVNVLKVRVKFESKSIKNSSRESQYIDRWLREQER